MEHHFVAGPSQNLLGFEAHPAQERIVGLDNPVRMRVDDQQVIGDAWMIFSRNSLRSGALFHILEVSDVVAIRWNPRSRVNHQGRRRHQADQRGAIFSPESQFVGIRQAIAPALQLGLDQLPGILSQKIVD